MDDRMDLAHYAIEKKYGVAECDCDGTCDLSFKLAGDVHHYIDKWNKIEDNHHTYCPIRLAAREKKISTLCLCDAIEKAEKAAKENVKYDECLRCHQFPEYCKCGEKAQLV